MQLGQGAKNRPVAVGVLGEGDRAGVSQVEFHLEGVPERGGRGSCGEMSVNEYVLWPKEANCIVCTWTSVVSQHYHDVPDRLGLKDASQGGDHGIRACS